MNEGNEMRQREWSDMNEGGYKRLGVGAWEDRNGQVLEFRRGFTLGCGIMSQRDVVQQAMSLRYENLDERSSHKCISKSW